MTSLKDIFIEVEDIDEHFENDEVEVYADSVKQALDLASSDLGIEVTMLDYEILEKGTRGLFGIGRQPYKVLIRPLEVDTEHGDLDELENKLSKEHIPGVTSKALKNADGSYKIRVTKSGIWFIYTPPKGKGKTVDMANVNNKLISMKIVDADISKIEKEIKNSSGEQVKIGEWDPNPDYDGSIKAEVSDDEMNAYIHFTSPKFYGRHMEVDEIHTLLQSIGVVSGIREEEIIEYLDNMNYIHPLHAAKGGRPRNGNDAFIEYKVKVDDTAVRFEEDESGKVDFKNLEMLENVVVGQLLAIKVPAEEGILGRTVKNNILPAQSGKDVRMQFGKGTILSEDGKELTAEINGQVVFKNEKISVEPVYVVNGDVSLETGNIIFLGSVVISGSVQDNFVVKAAGNIEVKGTVQKAFLEAEGDIIVYQGISGREEAKIESTGGSIYAKFIQNANVFGEKNIIVPEGILHSNVDAGENIYCAGRRARIVGGLIRAGEEINARFLGSDVSTKTEIRVGIHPKILQQIIELEDLKENITSELEELQLNVKSLTNQKKGAGKLPEEKEKVLTDLMAREEKMTERASEIINELEELTAYLNILEHNGKVCAEKSAFPGVDIYIKDQKFVLKDEYNNIKFSLEGGEIRLSEYEPPQQPEGQQKFRTLRRR